MNHRYPLQVVLDMKRCNKSELARRTGITRRTIQRWAKHGVTFDGADRLATALGTMPWLLWPEWDEDSLERAEALTPTGERRRLRARAYELRTRDRRREYQRQYYRRRKKVA